ncbi:major facilitator superfamily domain-containing protein [Boletus edulis]|nr:major facilitator superfamily domain-containing protein [Boletus edulis]
MSSPNQPPSETTALLIDNGPVGQPPSGNLLRKRLRFSPETLLIPVALATTLAGGITSTTFIELTRKSVCRFWNISRGDPATITTAGPSPLDLCDAPEVARYFAIVLAVLGVAEGVISIVGFGMFSRISSRYGRKPAFFLVLGAAIMSNCMIVGSQYMPDSLADWVFLVGMLFGVFSGPLGYLIDLYIVDECAPEDRTAALSKIAGWAGLGTCISFALGGTITTKTGNPLIVFHLATAIYVATFIYVISALPESFPEEKRNALLRMRPEPSDDRQPAPTRFAFLHIFEPLRLLIPSRRLDGSHNWRLAWCAIHTLLLMVASSYAWTALMVLATSKYHLSPQDTGFFFTSLSVSRTIFLMVIVPPLLRFLRSYYHRKIIRPLHEEEDIVNDEELEFETSDHLHVHLAAASCVMTAISLLGAAASPTSRTLILSGIFLGFGAMHGPTIRSLVVGSVDPLQQGEALATFEMVSNAGSILSPIIMGGILTATIDTTPLLLFYVHLVVVLMSSALLFLVRDSDRYEKLHEA